MTVRHIFEPKNIAVIGASTDPIKLGNVILKNIIDAGYKGKIYPINPKSDEVLGLKVYKSILDVPEDVDLAVFIIPSRFVPSTMEQCIEKGVKGAVVITGGFSEVGNHELENEMLEIAKKGNIRIIGPNCQGINNPHHGTHASWPLIIDKGPFSIISQSGTVFAALEMWASADGLGVSKAVALGNKKDVDEIDLINYFGEDPQTKVMAIYSEGINDGQAFMKNLKEASKKTPVVILKPGRTEAGAKAVMSHTRSLAGKDQIYDAAFKQCGAIRVKDIEELYDASKALAFLPKSTGKKILIVTSSGGAGILATDLASEYGYTLSEIPEDIKTKLKEELPGFCILNNPLDLTGSAVSELYETVMKHTLESDNWDAYLFVYGDPIPNAAELAAPLIKKSGKPVAICYIGGGDVQESESKSFHEHGIPCYPTPERAINGLYALTRYSEIYNLLKNE
ncbi:MAG: acetate--CoA ligase family protein [Candidatus Ranarchaeia archaeon]